VPKVPHAGENHRQPGCIRGLNRLLIPHCSTRLDNRSDAQGGRRFHPIGKGKESIRGQDGVPGSLARPLAGNAYAV
jgi:hypothetical protein